MRYEVYEQKRKLFKPERDIVELVFYSPTGEPITSNVNLTYLCEDDVDLPLVYPCRICGELIEEETYYRDLKGQENE